jgi:4a-hydroxytetrahydrobiopterin dehydratase
MSKTLWQTMHRAAIAVGVILLLVSSTLAAEVPVAQITLLSETQISEQMQSLAGWTTDGKQLYRTFQFNNFLEAMNFVNRLVEPAETAGHHPDIAISYNKVSISLTTHDAGGLTQQDFKLAQIISQLSVNSSN